MLLTTGATALRAQQAGDIAIVGFNADNPDAFAFVALAALPAGTTIHFTDNGWQAAGGFRANEGTFSYTVPGSGLTPGTVVTISEPAGPAFATSGDQLIAYTGSAGSPSLLYALNVEGAATWQADATNSNTSALPSGLVNGSTAVAVNELDNVVYAGPTSGTRSSLLAAIGDPSNWQGSNSAAQTFPASFDLSGDGGGNLAPGFSAALTDQDVVAGVPFSFDYDATDPEGTQPTYMLTDGPGSLNGGSGLYTWTPAASDAGQSFQITVTVSDGALTAQTTATLTVLSTAVNQPPRFQVGTQGRLVSAGSTATLTLTGTDPDGDALTFSILSGPSGAAITALNDQSAQLTYTTPSAPSVATFRIAVTDGQRRAITTVGIGGTGTLFGTLSGEALRSAVASAYAPNQTLGYNRGRDTLYAVVEPDANGTISGIYSGFTVQLDPSQDPSTYLFNNGINAEHTWPQSQGAGDEPQRSDMHILYPSKANVNSARGNNPFGEIADAQGVNWYRGAQSMSSPPTSDAGSWSVSGNTNFEPRDGVKGDVARAVFYFATMYSSTSSGFFESQVSTLLAWNATDPATGHEAGRSARIATYQGNINPFVLDPTLMSRMRGETVNLPPSFSATLTDQGVSVDVPFAFQYEATDPDGDAITYTLTDGPGALDANGRYTWTPSSSDAGQAFVVTVAVSDGAAAVTTSATLTVAPLASNAPPIFTTVLTDREVVVDAAFAFQYNAADADGDALTYTLTDGPGRMNANGQYTWTPTANEADQAFSITVTASDGQASVSTTAILSVVTRALVFGDVSGDGQLEAADATLILAVVANGTNLDSATVTRADVTGNGTVSAYDAAFILRRLVGLIDCFPAEAGCTVPTEFWH
ncbi:MAG: hypothetical protein RhofKO_41160 [Rhodothermales bacterium]